MIRRLTAIMFTDMVGYTAQMQRDEQQAVRNRDRQREILERLISQRGGDLLQYVGDGTLSVFQSAIAAVESAIAIQEEVRGLPVPIPMRIGIHSGDIVHDESGVYGDGVNLASRIEGLGVPGSILISGKVFDEMKNQPSIRAQRLGSFNLKNVAYPLTVYAISNKGLEIPPESSVRAARVAGANSILPFVNMSSDPENEFFSDGITEELINMLTRVNGLHVTARTSSFAFKGTGGDVRSMAEELSVTHILGGSVRRSGDRVRVTAQLISADNGYHLMSESYDRTLEDIFALQDEISAKIVDQLSDTLDLRRPPPMVRHGRRHRCLPHPSPRRIPSICAVGLHWRSGRRRAQPRPSTISCAPSRSTPPAHTPMRASPAPISSPERVDGSPRRRLTRRRRWRRARRGARQLVR